jgi:uncharacterized protein YneR
MNLQVSKEAAAWYKEELGLHDGDYVQFFVKIYGDQGSAIHPNYSLGIIKKDPRVLSIRALEEGVTFYFDAEDQWYLNDHNLTVILENDEIVFSYERLIPTPS